MNEFNKLHFKLRTELGTHKPNTFSTNHARNTRIDYPNGYGASVVTGHLFRTSYDKPYELAVFHNGNITYETPITNDVIGYLTATEVNNILLKIKEL